MMNILITGSNGQLGNEMRVVSKGSSHKYIFTDIAELDITNQQKLKAFVLENDIKVIVNCAAYTNVDKAEDDYETANLINNKAAEYLALVARSNEATLIHISTDYVFLGEGNTPCREDEPTNPIGAYGKTKLDGEQAIVNSGCKYLIFRTAWLYSSFGANFVKTMQRLTAERDTLKVVIDQIGTPTYAADLAELIYSIIEEDKLEGNEGIYHYSNEGVCSWYDFAIEIANQSGNTCDIQTCTSEEFPSKVKRPHFSVLDKTKVKETFGKKIPYWREVLERCIEEMHS